MQIHAKAINTDQEIASLVELVRPEVRAERAYRVATELDEAAKLDQNESPFDLPEEVRALSLSILREASWNRYPADRPHELIRGLARHFDWPAEGLIVGRGSNELTHTLGLTLIERGMPVVLPHPMFALYESVVRVHGGVIVPVDPEPDFSHTPAAVIEAMQRSGAPLTIVCSPNNPTGHSFSPEGLAEMADASPGLLVIDEAYVEFLEGPTALDVARDRPNVLVVRTFSKALGLAGLRLGYLAAHPALIAEIEKARLPFLVDRLSESVGLAMLQRQDLVAQRVDLLKKECARMLRALAGRDDVETIPTTANFFLLRTAHEPAILHRALIAEGVRIRNVSGYPALSGGAGPSGRFQTGWVRASVGTPAENSAFLAALDRVLQ